MHCYKDDSGRVHIVKGRETWKKYETSSLQMRVPVEIVDLVKSVKVLRASLYAYKVATPCRRQECQKSVNTAYIACLRVFTATMDDAISIMEEKGENTNG